MLKSGYTFFRLLFHRRSRHKFRTHSNWTDSYDSPEPSWLRKTANNTGERIFYHIDSFFQGQAIRNKEVISGGYLSNQNTPCIIYMEWDLNQDIADIAFKDIKSSLSWLIPGFIRKYAVRFQQLSLLYLYTDVVNEDESGGWSELSGNHTNLIFFDKRRSLKTIQGFKESIDAKSLSILNWWKKFNCRLNVFLKMEQEEKPFYLLGYFAPQGSDNSIDHRNFMIRGPDKTKLSPAYSSLLRI